MNRVPNNEAREPYTESWKVGGEIEYGFQNKHFHKNWMLADIYSWLVRYYGLKRAQQVLDEMEKQFKWLGLDVSWTDFLSTNPISISNILTLAVPKLVGLITEYSHYTQQMNQPWASRFTMGRPTPKKDLPLYVSYIIYSWGQSGDPVYHTAEVRGFINPNTRRLAPDPSIDYD